MFERIAGAPALWERPALSQQSARATATAPGATTNRWRHRGGRVYGGAVGFCNLRVTKVDGDIVLDPHITGACVIVLDERRRPR